MKKSVILTPYMMLKPYLEALVNRLKKTSLWTVFALLSFFFLANNYNDLIYWKPWKKPFISDAAQYYSYLPASCIDKSHNTSNPEIALIKTPNGGFVPKMSMGVAVMESPFFFLGDWIANHNEYEPNGYTPPYIWCIYFGTILYVMAGLWCLYHTLLLYFKPLPALLTVFAVFYATNLFFYTVSYGQMAHSFGFTLFCFFLYAAVRWQREKKSKYLFWCAFLGGLIFLVRPPDILLFIILPFLGVSNWNDLKDNFLFIWESRLKIVLAILLFLLTLSPQLIYWKIHTGHFYFDAYIGEHFFMTDPQLLNMLFSYRKGLIPYTPVMALAFIGFIPLYIRHRPLFWAT
ncbi:MAG TPA: glycosyltransferase family 39 protein, partial [Bacteroidia bacterium]|nr:glycosyltransferase family 39 protein [Bacteroidia bacterium]